MKIVYYDLETTGLNFNRIPRLNRLGVQVVSIGAYFKKDEKKFMNYMVPTVQIDPNATKINGMTLNDDGELTKNGSVVKDAVTIMKGLQDFLSFLEEEVIRKQDEKVILVAHNGKNFDSIVLKRNLNQHHLVLPKVVSFFEPYNTIIQAKERTPGFDEKVTLNNCLKFFLQEQQSEIHDAMEDTLSIAKITEYVVQKVYNTSVEEYLEKNPDKLFQPTLT